MRFMIADGAVIEKKEVQLSEEYMEASLRLSQQAWYGYGGIPLFWENLSLLKKQAEQLHLDFPESFAPPRELFRLIKRMLNKNKLYRSGHVHLQLFKGSQMTHSLVTCTSFSEFTFPYSEEGLLVKLSTQRKLSNNPGAGQAFYDERLWQMAMAEIEDTPFHQSIILNEKEAVCEGAFSNLFLVMGNELHTPSLDSGCYESALRSWVLKAAVQLGLKVTEKSVIRKENLLMADELFYASEKAGVQWILGIENQRFIRYYSEKIHEELHVLLKNKAAIHPR